MQTWRKFNVCIFFGLYQDRQRKRKWGKILILKYTINSKRKALWMSFTKIKDSKKRPERILSFPSSPQKQSKTGACTCGRSHAF